MRIATGKTVTSYELGHDFREDLRLRHEEPDKWRGLQFGHADLDKLTGGLRKGEFCIIAGAQKAGKTTATLAVLLNMAKQLQPNELALYISLEMTHDAIAGRLLANLADIEVSKFRDYAMGENDWSKLDRGIEKLDQVNALWNVGTGNITGIEEIVEEHKDNIRLVVVDYFQLMSGGSSYFGKRFEQLEEMSMRLKSLALQYDLSVIALSQQSREALKSSRQKDPNTLAGTQALARDCDLLLVILPHMEDDEEVPHLRKLYVALARNASADVTFNAFFSGAYCRFGAVTDIEVDEMPNRKEQYWNK